MSKRNPLPCYVAFKPCGCTVVAVGERPPEDGREWRRVAEGEEVKMVRCTHREAA